MNELAPDLRTGLLTKAKEGDTEALIESVARIYPDDEKRDAEIYRWLTISEGFGNDVEDLIDGMTEASSLRYDDDGLVRGEIHFELGMSYLLGENGLPMSFEIAEANLSYAKEFNYPDGIMGAEKIIDSARARLSASAAERFDGIFPAS